MPSCATVYVQAATVGDPRRPQEVKKVGAVTVPAPDDTISQTILIAAMSAGVSALMFQVSCCLAKTVAGRSSHKTVSRQLQQHQQLQL